MSNHNGNPFNPNTELSRSKKLTLRLGGGVLAVAALLGTGNAAVNAISEHSERANQTTAVSLETVGVDSATGDAISNDTVINTAQRIDNKLEQYDFNATEVGQRAVAEETDERKAEGKGSYMPQPGDELKLTFDGNGNVKETEILTPEESKNDVGLIDPVGPQTPENQ